MCWHKPSASAVLGQVTVGSVDRLGSKGWGGLCPAPMRFPHPLGRSISAEDMRIKGLEQPDRQRMGAPEQVRFYQVSLKPCTELLAALTTVTSPAWPGCPTSHLHRAPLFSHLAPAPAILCGLLPPIPGQWVDFVTFAQYLASWGLGLPTTKLKTCPE